MFHTQYSCNIWKCFTYENRSLVFQNCQNLANKVVCQSQSLQESFSVEVFYFQTLTSVFLLWLIISTCIKKMYYSTFPFQFVQCNFFFAELQLRFFTLFNYLRLLCITIVYYNYSLNFGLLSTSTRDQKSYLGLSFLHEFFSQNY